jgi:hypothetical protein
VNDKKLIIISGNYPYYTKLLNMLFLKKYCTVVPQFSHLTLVHYFSDQNLKMLSESAQKALWADSIIQLIKVAESPTSFEDLTLREKILQI